MKTIAKQIEKSAMLSLMFKLRIALEAIPNLRKIDSRCMETLEFDDSQEKALAEIFLGIDPPELMNENQMYSVYSAFSIVTEFGEYIIYAGSELALKRIGFPLTRDCERITAFPAIKRINPGDKDNWRIDEACGLAVNYSDEEGIITYGIIVTCESYESPINKLFALQALRDYIFENISLSVDF